jgi:hypothetical protein
VSVATTTPFDYVVAILTSMAAPLRTGHLDLMLSTLFWGGFGWSDTVPPELLIATLSLATAMALGWILWRAGAERDARRLVLLTALIVGLGASLAASALGAYALRYDLYGRYLVGWYLQFVIVAWMAPSTVRVGPWWAWLIGVLAVHAYCLQLIAIRYF